MKNTGIVRRLDELGRITLPIELRRNLDIGEKDPVEIYVSEDMIILKKFAPVDTFTGTSEDLVEFHGKMVSRDSIKELAKIAGIIE
ncbi:MAG: AbrB/MazE/SpoVT family DNA-binding domain-containing protein [Lachnospiraceae bacterium]|nr:AbrB/MazE/SpoVT family DNA-binding domain-containing protein [Lachnospiraceae bacterium]MBP3610042.1 AbrB/MazE/SpoVT family DNA-binding domain-containing protein [Lachnospiraceae bacterium]